MINFSFFQKYLFARAPLKPKTDRKKCNQVLIMGDYHQRRDTCEITRKHRQKVSSGAEAVYMHQDPTLSPCLHPTAPPRWQLSTGSSGFTTQRPCRRPGSTIPSPIEQPLNHRWLFKLITM